MADFEEMSFVIPGYTPETMPLDRLIEYLQQISIIVSDAQNLHLVEIKKSSVAPTFSVPKVAAERVKEQAYRVGRGEGTKVQKTAYNRLRHLVRRDAMDLSRPAILRSDSHTVLEVPAAPDDTGVVSGIRQFSQVDGKLIRIGGDGEYASLQMTDLEDRLLSGFTVRHNLVKDMARLIYEPIRISGVGIWNRDEEGIWSLVKMEVQSYETLEEESLEIVFDKMRELNVEWPEDAIQKMLADREAGL